MLENKKKLAFVVASGALAVPALAGGTTPNSNESWLSADRSEELQALMQEVVADSSRRTSLLSANGTGGWDNGFYLQSDDGAFVMKFFFQAQIRAVWNLRDDASGQDGSIFGFSNRRTKAGVKGNLYGDELTYKINGGFSNSSGIFELEDAYIKWQASEQYALHFGQFKAPFLLEESNSSSYLLGVERSYVNELGAQNRTQGVGGTWEPQENLQVQWAFTDGWPISPFGPNADGKNTPWNADVTDYALTGRVDYVIQEDNDKQFRDYQSKRDEDMGIRVGAAAHFQDSEHGTPAADMKVFAWTVDGQVEFGGAHVEGYVLGQHFDMATPGAADFDQIGFVLSGGVFLDEKEMYELFARYEWYDFDSALPSAYSDDVSLVSGGVNVFFAGHNRKWTTDVVWALDPLFAGNASTGLLSDASNSDDQFVIRSQFQLLF